MLNELYGWLHAKADAVSAVGLGVLVTVAFGWRNPGRLLLQVISAIVSGVEFGPVANEVVIAFTPLKGDAITSACQCLMAICGVYIIEGFILMAQRWSKNPTIPAVRLHADDHQSDEEKKP